LDGEGMKRIIISINDNETSIEFEEIESKMEAIGVLEVAKYFILTEKIAGPSDEGRDAER
jgi:hypothetical protein